MSGFSEFARTGWRFIMKLFCYALLVFVGINFSACKLERKDDSEAKMRITDAVGNELGNVALTLLSFRNKTLSSWEVHSRMQCGDHRPMVSRIDDMHYELQPEAVYRSIRKVQPGDHATCRYQNSAEEASLFRDKLLAIKVKYPRQYSNSPPPLISFTSGMGVRVSPDKFRSTVIGNCSDFQSSNNLLYCKTIDRQDGRVIWLALVAPQNSAYVPITTGNVGGKVFDVTQMPSKGGKMVATGKGVVQSNVQSSAQAPGKFIAKGTTQAPSQIPSKGGKGGMVGQHGFTSPAGGRIEMQITLPYLPANSIPLAVNVPHFNFELLNQLHSPTGGFYIEDPVDSPHTTNYGDELQQEEIVTIVERPMTYPNNPSKPETLRLTIKSNESRHQEGRWSGIGKFAIGAGGIAAGIVLLPLGLGVALPVVGAAATKAIVIGTIGGLGATSGLGGLLDLNKWRKTAANKGSHMDFLVNSNTTSCPSLYSKTFTLGEKDRYIELKGEKRGSVIIEKWWNIGEIESVPRSKIGTNRWTVATVGEGEAFRLLLCRKEFENHCREPDESMYSESVLTRLAECKKLGDEDKLVGEIGN